MTKLWWLVILMVILTACVPHSDPWLFTGSVESDEVDVSPEVSGIIEVVYVKDGDRVKTGDKLMQLNTEDYELKLALLHNAKAMAELSYSDLEDGNSQSQIRSARANVKNIDTQIVGSETELAYLQNDLGDIQALYDAGASSLNDLDQAQRLLDRELSKIAGLKRQREAYVAQLDLVLEGATNEAIESAYLLVEQKQLEIKDLERTISKSTLYSPVTGYVQNVNYHLGEWISLGSKTTTIIDTSQLWIIIYVPEKQLNKVSLGDQVTFTDGFLEGRKVSGEVAYISSEAEFTPKNIESKENKQEMVFEVKIAVTDPSETIKPGMFLDIHLAGE